MLSLAKVSNSKEASQYYEETDNYYNEGGKAPSKWLMVGAQRLGLKGSVDAEQFKQLLDGHMPDGSIIANARDGRRSGTDCTFSAPKSISMQALIGGDKSLINAHEQAVNKALSYIEGMAAYRATENGVTHAQLSNNLLVAAFRHDVNRAVEPNLHTHAILINTTQREDGHWRALDVSEVYRQQKLIGALYRSELALAVKELGYEIQRTHSDGRFELAHINREQIEGFSSRSQAIEAELEIRGKTRESATTAEKQIVTLSTREEKKQVDRKQLQIEWKNKSKELGVNYHPEMQTSKQNIQAAKTAVDYAIKHTTERQAVINEAQLLQSALEGGTGETNLNAIRKEIQRQVTTGELIQQDNKYTTELAQAREREMLATEERGREALIGIMEKSQAEAKLSLTQLNAGQKGAATLIVSSQNRFAVVQGAAGTGKTTMLKTAQTLINEKGFNMIGVAPSAAAANELSSNDIESQTLARFQAQNFKGLDEKTVVILDEASMVSAKDMHTLMDVIDSKGARAVMIGDTQQLKSVEAGRPFAQLQQAGIERAEMGEIQRQHDAQLKQAVKHASQGDITSSLSTIKHHVQEIEHNMTRYSKIAQDYVQLSEAERKNTSIVAGTHSARTCINERVRDGLGLVGQGKIVESLIRKDLTTIQTKMSQSYQPGDVVQALKNYKGLGIERNEQAIVTDVLPGQITLKKSNGKEIIWRPAIETKFNAFRVENKEFSNGDNVRITQNDYGRGLANGDLATVKDVNDKNLTLTLSNGREISMDTTQRLHLDHAYCLTIYSSQGQTVQRVLIDSDTKSLTANESSYYVAISRAQLEAKIYTDDKEMLPEAISRVNEKSAALDIDNKQEVSLER